MLKPRKNYLATRRVAGQWVRVTTITTCTSIIGVHEKFGLVLPTISEKKILVTSYELTSSVAAVISS